MLVNQAQVNAIVLFLLLPGIFHSFTSKIAIFTFMLNNSSLAG